MNDSKSPFKVGDKVEIKDDPYGILSKAGFRLNTVYTVKEIDSETCRIHLKETLGCLHYTHFKLYKEEDTTMTNQQKTKRVPFTHELWEKWKDKGGKVIDFSGREITHFTWFDISTDYVYAGVYDSKTAFSSSAKMVGTFFSHHLLLEIPVTTKRIPFNPELKNAKVYAGNTPIEDWGVFNNSGLVFCTYIGGSMMQETQIVHRSKLEMEIEED